MYHVSPNQGDLFYLRILLCNVKGATDFSELFSLKISITKLTRRHVLHEG
jgi:hypothetical protein